MIAPETTLITIVLRRRGGGGWRGLLCGALAGAVLIAAAPARALPADGGPAAFPAPSGSSGLELRDDRLRGELRGVRVDAAVAELARLLGARLVWRGDVPEGAVHVDLTGLTVDQGLARLLRGRSYLLLLGSAPEVQVLASGGDGVWRSPASVDPEAERLRTLRRVAEIERAGAQAESADSIADLDAVARGPDPGEVRLLAAERLLALDPARAAAALAFLSADADAIVRGRAEALLAVARQQAADGRRAPEDDGE